MGDRRWGIGIDDGTVEQAQSLKEVVTESVVRRFETLKFLWTEAPQKSPQSVAMRKVGKTPGSVGSGRCGSSTECFRLVRYQPQWQRGEPEKDPQDDSLGMSNRASARRVAGSGVSPKICKVSAEG